MKYEILDAYEFPDRHWLAGQTETCALEILVGDNECSIEVY